MRIISDCYIFNYFGLKNTKKPSLAEYCLVAYFSVFFPAITIFYIALSLIGSGSIGWNSRGEIHFGFIDLFGLTLLSPIVETWMLSGIVYVLLKKIKPRIVAALITAFIFAFLHGVMSPIWFFGTFWPFFVFSFSYISWRTQSFNKAFIAACVPHSLHNLTVFMLLHYSKLSSA